MRYSKRDGTQRGKKGGAWRKRREVERQKRRRRANVVYGETEREEVDRRRA